MKGSSNLFILTSLLLVLVFKLAFTGKWISWNDDYFLCIYQLDASALFNDKSIMENSASDENDASLRSKKDTSLSAAQHFIPSPHRRHHLKFGVLGKRYAYGYLGKRNDGMRYMKDSNRPTSLLLLSATNK